MLRWLILAVVVGGLVYWLGKGRSKNQIEDPEAKEVDQKRFYVKTDDRSDPPVNDDESDEL